MRAGVAGLGAAMVIGLGMPSSMAQLMLPGAVAPTQPNAGAAQAHTPARPAKPRPAKEAAGPGAEPAIRKGTPVTIPSLSGLGGHVVALNGAGSQMTFAPGGKAVSQLTLQGNRISNSLETCHIEASPTPLAVTPLVRLNGLERFKVEFPACPVAFDVLDGAILVDREQPACEFQNADCRVPVAGLWGPGAAEIGPERLKGLERARAAAEAAVRSNYKALVSSTRDRPTIMGFAREQARFSSIREETCRDYADEGRHGYCSAKLTEARAAHLHDDLAAAIDAKAARKAGHRQE